MRKTSHLYKRRGRRRRSPEEKQLDLASLSHSSTLSRNRIQLPLPQKRPNAHSPSPLLASPSAIEWWGQAQRLPKAHYVGMLENGKVFDSSYSRGKPLTFRVGVGEVIKGWDQGILGGEGVPPMLAGGKRTLKLPPQLGYGMRGAGCKGGSCIIPPDSVLLFDVEFIGKA
eukprot:TRINITY_DN45321_c0_g1_i5.p1 TRINITY_DN45321_c0_g1~~TRINITY_DN45321_c0_g1_i5.p1  ORF type:complete len:170 (-),score=36.12 TRINITY_DN45321_c0_g1_i5:726-1235(-)